VLIVDDEPAILRTLGRLFASAGYEAFPARDGGQAIAAIHSQAPFDAVVSDLEMPDIDGMTFLRAIRARDLDLPVVFLTGRPSVDSAAQALEHGAFRYLVKPAPTAEMLDAVSRAVRWRRMALVRQDVARQQGVAGAAEPDPERGPLEVRFASALDHLWAAMQPIVSWGARDVFAYEALVRSEEPSLRNPVDLFAAAERLDRVRDLSRAVRQRVAASLRQAPESALVFVNLHPTDLEDPELASPDAPLSAYAHRIVLEITESVGVDRVRGFGAHVARLRALGYRIALDDLGAGYAGLSSFAQIEPDVVKADMALVRGIDGSQV
jgi:EAL domain-containing protein (putative c-di-GMP-specific phosphodiesterase class I)/CheY-like chemotaxis protein